MQKNGKIYKIFKFNIRKLENKNKIILQFFGNSLAESMHPFCKFFVIKLILKLRLPQSRVVPVPGGFGMRVGWTGCRCRTGGKCPWKCQNGHSENRRIINLNYKK